MFETLQQKTHTHEIILHMGENYTEIADRPTGLAGYSSTPGYNGEGASSTVYYDYKNEQSPSGEIRTPEIGLAHELSHAYDLHLGQQNSEKIDPLDKKSTTYAEATAVNFENTVREKLGYPKRTKYGDYTIPSHLLYNEGATVIDIGNQTFDYEIKIDTNESEKVWKNTLSY